MVVLQRQNIRDPFNSIKTGVILMKSFDNYYHAESISFSDKNILILVLVVKKIEDRRLAAASVVENPVLG